MQYLKKNNTHNNIENTSIKTTETNLKPSFDKIIKDIKLGKVGEIIYFRGRCKPSEIDKLIMEDKN